MHSHDKTLLAKLGFNDSDRKEINHDLACKYLAYEVPTQVIDSLLPADPEEWKNRKVMVRGVTEMHLTKGDRQYITTVGFIDVIICRGHMTEGGKYYHPTNGILIEVKIDPEPMSDTIRQIKFYESFTNYGAYILATINTVEPRDLQQLAAENIKHIQLGKAFRDWCKSEPAESDVPKSLEF
jgi:hypothetical protein